MNNNEKDNTHDAAAPSVPEGFAWPAPPPGGQSHVLFDDGYAEGWAKAIDTVRTMLSAGTAAKSEQARSLMDNSALPKHLLTGSATAAGAGSAQPRAEGDERADFEAWHRSKFATKHSTGQPTRDMHNGVYAEKYGPEHQQQMWESWQARASIDHGARAATTASASGIMTWQERAQFMFGDEWQQVDSLDLYMQAEIADLRAALARAPLPAPEMTVVIGGRRAGRTHATVQRIIEAMSADAKARTSYGNIRDVLDAMQRMHGVAIVSPDDQAQPVDDARDAARYRWLRSQESSLETQQRDMGIINGPSCYHEVEGIRELKWGVHLDAAVDAAMRANDSAAEGGQYE